jgi:hypothetical protein
VGRDLEVFGRRVTAFLVDDDPAWGASLPRLAARSFLTSPGATTDYRRSTADAFGAIHVWLADLAARLI